MLLQEAVEHLIVLVFADAEARGPRPVWQALARAFPGCPAWREDREDERLLRRARLLCGGAVQGSPPLPQGTVLAALGAQGVSWRAAHHGVSTASLFAAHGPGAVGLMPVSELYTALDGRGAPPLPRLVWVDPDFTRPGHPGSDDHNAGHPGLAEGLLARVYDALREGPYWERSLLWVLADRPHAGRPPLLISPWLSPEQALPRGMGPDDVAALARALFGRGPGPASPLAALDVGPTPRRDTPRRLTALTLPDREPGHPLQDAWQAWLATQPPAPALWESVDALGRRGAEGIEQRAARMERRIADAGEALTLAGERAAARVESGLVDAAERLARRLRERGSD